MPPNHPNGEHQPKNPGWVKGGQREKKLDAAVHGGGGGGFLEKAHGENDSWWEA